MLVVRGTDPRFPATGKQLNRVTVLRRQTKHVVRQKTTMNSTEEARLFNILDEYSRGHHQCFVTELFLDPSHPRYFVCFRPVDVADGDVYRFYYLHLPLSSAESIVAQFCLTAELKDLLDEKLTDLRLGRKVKS
jgi:hypothetical protein